MYTCDNPECKKRLNWLNSKLSDCKRYRHVDCPHCGVGTKIPAVKSTNVGTGAWRDKPTLCKVIDEAKTQVRKGGFR